MPNKRNYSNPQDQSKRPKRKHNNKIIRDSSKKSKQFNQSLKLIRFENSLAARVKDEDIIRACSLYNKTQEKIIKFKISQIYFN